MQLILELLKKIFVALQGVYTKAETDSALGLKADATALTEEAERVDTRLAEHDAEIETLQKVTAGLGEGAQAAANVAKWQTYATAIQKEVDSETAMQLAQEFSRATDEYLADPAATKEWGASNPPNANGKPLVDFNVETIVNGYLNGETPSNIIFVPSASTLSSSHSRLDFSGRSVFLFAPAGKAVESMFNQSRNIDKLFVVIGSTYPTNMAFEGCLANEICFKGVKVGDYSMSRTFSVTAAKKIIIDIEMATRSSNLFYEAKNLEEVQADFSNMLVATRMFYGATAFDKALAFPSLFSGDDMFLNSGMSAENISAVLDSLPSDPVAAGGTGVITFTGCPGAAELTQDSPSVAAAIAKGWEVRL
jgi:hypothetical protein